MAYYPLATEFGAIYTLTNGAWTAVFNEPLDPNYVGMLTEVTGLDSAEVRENATDLVESDGGVHGAFYMGRRPIVLNGKVFGHATIRERQIRLDKARNASLALRSDATLAWIPSTRNGNLVKNPSAKNNVTDGGWSAVNASAPVRTTTVARTGPSAFQITSSAAGNYSLRNTGSLANMAPVIPGKTYTVSAYTRTAVGTTPRNSNTYTDWYDAAGVRISAVPGAAVANTTGAWARPFTTGVAPPGAVGLATIVEFTGGTAAGEVQYIDDIMVNEGSLPAAYSDGDTSGWYWHGDAHNSTSGNYVPMFVPVRRQQPFRESGAWVKDFQIPLVSQYSQIFGWNLKTSATTAAGTSVVVENQGNFPAYPILRITGVSGNTTAVTDGHGGTFKTLNSLSLAAGEVVEFDMLNHTGVFTIGARAGQSATRYIDFMSITQWPALLTGNNTFTLAAGAAGSLTVLYRDTWA
jgi:hypothetical protein